MATDWSFEARLAEGRARLLAAVLNAELRILHVHESGAVSPRPGYQQSTSTGLADERITLETLSGDPCELICHGARGSDLLVLGEPRRRSTDGLFTGTTGERIIRRVTVPVLVVRTEATVHYRRVVLAVDLSPQAMEIMRVGKALKIDSADCQVIHVYDTPQTRLMIWASSYSFHDVQRHIAQEQRKHVRKLNKQMRQADLRGRANAIMIESSAASAILGFAQRAQADLLILGSRRRSNLARLVLGSVAKQVLDHSKMDVLIVPPDVS